MLIIAQETASDPMCFFASLLATSLLHLETSFYLSICSNFQTTFTNSNLAWKCLELSTLIFHTAQQDLLLQCATSRMEVSYIWTDITGAVQCQFGRAINKWMPAACTRRFAASEGWGYWMEQDQMCRESNVNLTFVSVKTCKAQKDKLSRRLFARIKVHIHQKHTHTKNHVCPCFVSASYYSCAWFFLMHWDGSVH